MVMIPSNNLIVPVGTNSHQLTCIVTLSSPIGPNISALSISWQRSGQMIRSLHDRTQVSEPEISGENTVNSKLTLSTISEHDSGEYCCTASIAGNQTELKSCVELKVTTDGEQLIQLLCNFLI